MNGSVIDHELRGRRVLVTGAGGFIGRHLVAALGTEGAEVTALTRATCDLTDRRAVTQAVVSARPDAVLHLAAARAREHGSQRLATVAVNALSGVWVLEAAPDHCRTVVRLGSSTEYAAQPGPMAEDTPLRPRGYFGATKAAGSLLWAATAAERGFGSCELRAFQVYGPGDHPTRFVPTVLAAAAAGTELPLTGPGLRRDWVWVGDVVEACLLAASGRCSEAGLVLNIGTGCQTTNEDLVALAETVTGRRIRFRAGAHPGRDWDTGSWVCDPTAAAAHLGWKPQTSLAEGLAHCWAAR